MVGQLPLKPIVISAIEYTVLNCSNCPVARQQAYLTIYNWAIKSYDVDLTDSGYIFPYDEFKCIILLSISDVWSPTRKNCIRKLYELIENFDENRLKNLYISFIDLYNQNNSNNNQQQLQQQQQTFTPSLIRSNSTSSNNNNYNTINNDWRIKEGCIMGLGIIIKSYRILKIPTKDNTAEYKICLGTDIYNVVPEYIADNEDILLNAIQDQQQSVREYGVKTITLYLNRTSIISADNSLCQEMLLNIINNQLLPIIHKQKNINYIEEPFKTEGLIQLSIVLIKYLNFEFINKNFEILWNVYCLFLFDNASTVRQAVSERIVIIIYIIYYIVFVQLMTKDMDANLFLHFFDSLVSFWNINEVMVLSSLNSPTSQAEVAPETEIEEDYEEEIANQIILNENQIWQKKEGLLLCYELIFKYLIKSHSKIYYKEIKKLQQQHKDNINNSISF